MKAMLFAAGLGTRLRPLTLNRPKALVEVCGMPLLEWNLRALHRYGFTEVVVNVHHFAEQVEEWLAQHTLPGMRIHISDERALLLDTGGGLWQARAFFAGEPEILVCNADVISDADLGALLQAHRRTGADATLAVRVRESSRYFLFDAGGRLSGWENAKSGEQRLIHPQPELHRRAFSGIQVLNPALLERTALRGVFGLVDFYLEQTRTAQICAWEHAGLWMDLGKAEELPAMEAALRDSGYGFGNPG